MACAKSKYNKPSQLAIGLATSLKNLCGRERKRMCEREEPVATEAPSYTHVLR
jgi:hypothetical protein